MTISPFFLELRSAYQSEMDDLTFDSEGRDVLRQRLVEKRKELGFLLQMIELSPEMVAVIFHQGMTFRRAAVMEHLLTLESDEFPEWDALSDAIELTGWAEDLARLILAEPMGSWFMCIAAALQYMYNKPDASQRAKQDGEDDDDSDDTDENGDDPRDELDSDDEEEARAREEAGADWMVEQGFDRKD